MQNIKLTIAYDGTRYHGFQTQANASPTIQGTLERVLSRLTKEEIKIQGAGRTDAGVHARGQVISFRTNAIIPLEKWTLATNSWLPKDITVLKAEAVPWEFHARFDALGKTYCYQIYNHRIHSPFHRNFAWHIPVNLDVQAMAEAAQIFLGCHDFSSFQAKDTRYRHPVRTLYRLEVDRDGPLISLTFQGDGFLYNMVRIITGTLVRVGKGRLSINEAGSILASRHRPAAGATAPPQGLYLEKVYYEENKGELLDRPGEIL